MFIYQFFISESNNDGVENQKYCLKCVRLSRGECECQQCKKCKLFYANIKCHKCPKITNFCITCYSDITSSTNLCYDCDMDAILDICESITPTKQINAPQCLRCLDDMVENRPCPCKPCTVCNLYCPVDKPHIRCRQTKQICHDCDNYIISSSKKCLLCELKKQKTICKKCPLLIKEK